MAVGDIWEGAAYCTLGNQVSVSRRYWRVDQELLNGGGATNIRDSIATRFNTTLPQCLSNQATYRGVQVVRIWPLPRQLPMFNTTAAGAGGAVGDALPRQVRGIVTYTTAWAGRKFRGRTYVPFPCEIDNEANASPTAAYIVKLGAFADAVTSSITVDAGGGNISVLLGVLVTIKYVGGVLQNPSPTLITGYVARDRWATQRRSGDYGQANTAPF